MFKGKRILGVIPARGRSKGLPKKNIRKLCGKPLIAWTIEQALASKYLDKVIVSTDDREIANIALTYGAEVPFLRPHYLATDRAKSIDVILHTLSHIREKGLRFDYLLLLEPTSPLRDAHDINISIELLINNRVGAVSLVSVCKVESVHPSFLLKINKKHLISPYLGSFSSFGRRQDLSELYFPEGTIYLSVLDELIKRNEFYHNKTLGYIVPRWKSLEVDDITDFICIEAIMKNLTEINKKYFDCER